MEEKKKKGGVLWIIVLIILLVLFAVIGYFVRMNLLSVGHNTEIDTKTLKSELVSINELATYQQEYRETVRKDENDDEIFSKQYYATFDGVIRAGFKMDDVVCRVNNPPKDSDRPAVVNIKLPDAVVLDHTDDNWDVVYESGFGRGDIGKDRNKAISEKKLKKEKEFIEDGGLDKAKERGKEVIGDFIKSAYGDNVVIKFDGETWED